MVQGLVGATASLNLALAWGSIRRRSGRLRRGAGVAEPAEAVVRVVVVDDVGCAARGLIEAGVHEHALVRMARIHECADANVEGIPPAG